MMRGVSSDVKYRPWGPPYTAVAMQVRQRRSSGRSPSRNGTPAASGRFKFKPSLDSRCPAQGGLMCT
ncbi:unnamed protein product [Ectocarpus sp. 13 AM-2016]